VDLVENQIVAFDGSSRAVVIHQTDGESGHGQQPQQPWMIDAHVGRPPQ